VGGRRHNPFLRRILIAKELVRMKIRNNEELKLFEETLDRCSASVLVMTPQGDQYDLKDPMQRCLGIAEMIREEGAEEPELFASSREDEMRLFKFLDAREKMSA
jgi:hypothetical protein